jgi:hypothetical protein
MVTEDVHDRSVDCMNTSFLFGDGSIKLQKKITLWEKKFEEV